MMAAYTKQTWADDPATSSPISAARLNHIEDGIYNAVPAHDEVTRTLCWSNGGQGIVSSLASVTNWSFRFAFRLEASTVKWRLRLSNCDSWTPATKTAQNLATVKVGTHLRTISSSALGAETGNFTGSTATTLFSGSSTIPGDYSQLVTSWFTEPLTAGTEYLLALGGSGSSSTLPLGVGRCWYWSNATSGVDPTVLGSAATTQAQWMPLDVVIEYETTSRQKAVLVLGDSIFEGTSAVRGAAISPTSLLRTPVNQWARRKGLLVQNHSLYGIPAMRVAVSTDRIWTRQPIAGGAFDAAVIEQGTNDIDLSSPARTSAQIQGDIETIVGLIQTAIGADKPIYAVTINARNYSGGSAQETKRTDINSWLATLPAGLTGVVDTDAVMRSTSATQPDAALVSSDSIHPSHAGQSTITTALCAAVHL